MRIEAAAALGNGVAFAGLPGHGDRDGAAPV
jgi:hypothetical protein